MERKATFDGDVPRTVRQAICAFANDLPDRRRAGVVFIGVRDDGTTARLLRRHRARVRAHRRGMNGGVPQGEQWHRQLITDMSLEISGVRPAVIDPDLAEEFADYLRFRHVFRNVYGSLLQAERMRPLEERLPRVLAAFLTQVRTFLAWMVGGPAD